MAKKITSEDIELNLIVNGKKAQAEYQKVTRTIRDTKSELMAVKAEMKQMEREGKANTASYKDLDKQMVTLNRTLTSSIAKQKELVGQMKTEEKTVEQLKQSIRTLTTLRAKAVPNSAEYAKYNAELAKSKDRLRELEGGTKQTGNSIKGMIGQYAGWAAAAAAARAALQKLFDTNLKYESLMKGLSESSDDYEEFERNLEFLRETTNRLGLEFYSTAGAFKQWQGSAKFSNLTAEESRKIFESVANAGAKMKLSNEQVEGTFLALSQMLSKGKVQAEELRGQLGERLPGAFALAAKAMGTTEQGLNDMLEKGEIVADEFLPRFADQLDVAFGNDKTEKIEGMQASVNRLSNEWENLWNSKGASNFFETVSNGLANMLRDITGLMNSSSAREFWGLFWDRNYKSNTGTSRGSVSQSYLKKPKTSVPVTGLSTYDYWERQDQGLVVEETTTAKTTAGTTSSTTKKKTGKSDAERAREKAIREAQREAERLKKEQERLLEEQRKYVEEIIFSDKTLVEQENIQFDERLKKAGLFGVEREKMTEEQLQAYEILTNQHQEKLTKIEQEATSKRLSEELKASEQAMQARMQQAEQEYLQQMQMVNQSNASEEEKNNQLLAIEESFRQRKLELEQEDALARVVLLEAAIASNDLEINEAQRAADEKNRIQREYVNRQIAEAKREQIERLKIERELSDATYDIKLETAKAHEAAFSIMGSFFEENTAMAKMFLVLEKAAAAAHVIINLQKEISGYFTAASMAGMLNPVAQAAYTALAVKQAAAAKIRAGISLATIAATTLKGVIGGGGSEESSSSNRNSNRSVTMQGREAGGYLDVTRSQDGRHFKAVADPARRGYVGRPTVIVGESGAEWVASADTVRNPIVKPILDVLDQAQRNGTINTIGLSDIISKSLGSSRLPGRQVGGTIAESGTTPTYATDPLLIETLTELKDRIGNIRAEVSLLGKNGFLEKMDEYNNIKNESQL